MMPTKKRVLIVCTGNSCRSQMAESLWAKLGSNGWAAESAGSSPAGIVHPLAVDVMHEVGIDISANRSKHIDEFVGQSFDLIVTVCDGAKESCPLFPGAMATLHWPFDDPARFSGSDEEQLQVFRRVRDEVKQAIQAFLQC